MTYTARTNLLDDLDKCSGPSSHSAGEPDGCLDRTDSPLETDKHRLGRFRWLRRYGRLAEVVDCTRSAGRALCCSSSYKQVRKEMTWVLATHYTGYCPQKERVVTLVGSVLVEKAWGHS